MQFLFERLSVTPRGLDGRHEPFDEIAAILAQIQRIVASNRLVGEGIGAVPWGMSSITTVGAESVGQVDAYAKRLAAAIAMCEPRLRDVRVDVERGEQPLMPYRLKVTALFPGEDEPRDLHVPAHV